MMKEAPLAGSVIHISSNFFLRLLNQPKPMERKTYHVTQKTDGTWQGKLPAASRASIVGDTKAQVLKQTVELARSQPLSQVVIHKSREHWSVIQSERTYGNDPQRYPG